MEIDGLIIEITVILGAFGLFFFIKNFLPSYFNEKGKNLATKEDVEIITEKVERIKSEFIKDLEFIKTDLHYVSQSKFSIKTFEREALIDVNLKYAEWINYLMNLSFADINMSNYSRLDKFYEEIKSRKNSFDNAESNLHLFLHDETLINSKLICVTETIKLEQIIVKAIADISNHYSLMTKYFAGIAELKPDAEIEWVLKQKAVAQEDLDKIFFAMNNEKLKQFNLVQSKRVVFVKTLQSRLLDIIN